MLLINEDGTEQFDAGSADIDNVLQDEVNADEDDADNQRGGKPGGRRAWLIVGGSDDTDVTFCSKPHSAAGLSWQCIMAEHQTGRYRRPQPHLCTLLCHSASSSIALRCIGSVHLATSQ